MSIIQTFEKKTPLAQTKSSDDKPKKTKMIFPKKKKQEEEKPVLEVVKEEAAVEEVEEISEATEEPQKELEAKEEEKPAPKKKRQRRTKAQIEADKKAAKKNGKEEEDEEDTDFDEESEESMNEETEEEMPEKTKKSSDKTEVQEEPFEMPITKCTFSEALKITRPQFEDKSWHDLKEQVQDLLNQAIITADINSAQMANIREALATARALIEQDFYYYRSEVSRLGGKEPKGSIQLIEALNNSGSNEAERRKSGIMACMNYKGVNLYEFYNEMNERYIILQGYMETIKWRSDILINVAATLKLESQHLPTQV